MIWRSGGEAFSPGKLSAKSQPKVVLKGYTSHAEFETQCSQCHAPLKTTQDVLCLDCHTDIAAEVKAKNGTHGHIANVNQCALCHTDHHGQDFDPTQAAFTKFDHSITPFSLVWHQVNYDTTPMECTACHTMNGAFKTSLADCATCHAKKDIAFMIQHTKDFGENCVVCHDGQDRMIHFDHQKTAFPLLGKHAEASCADCHGLSEQAVFHKGKMQPVGTQMTSAQPGQDPFKDTPTDCAGCHVEPQAHLGMFSQDCASCHNTSAWKPAKLDGADFEHARKTGFTLIHHAKDYDGKPITCNTCHQSDIHNFDVQNCITCHSQGEERAVFMKKHLADFGPDCMQCHDGADRMNNFNHADFFPLDGQHSEIKCDACHANQVFKGTPTVCVQCHAEPKIHAGFFGLKCEYCHSTSAWAPAALKIHNFPLDHGGQGQQDCKLCHTSRYTEYTCYGCHDHQPGPITESHTRAGISLEELPDCAKCHPAGLVEQKTP
jgi:hypothetical protein